MDVPASGLWQEPLPYSRQVHTYRRVPQLTSSLSLVLPVAVLLFFPGLLSLAGGLTGVPIRDEPQTLLCNLGLAVAGGGLLLWYLFQRLEQWSASQVRLTLDENGIGESGHANPQNDWRLPWTSLQSVVLTGHEEGERVLRLYTLNNSDRPAYLLFDYRFEEIAPEIAERLSAAGRKMIVSV